MSTPNRSLNLGCGRGEKRKLSASRPAMSSQELMISGRVGSDHWALDSERKDLGSERSGEGKMDPRVNRGGGVGAVVAAAAEAEEGGWGDDGGSRVRRP